MTLEYSIPDVKDHNDRHSFPPSREEHPSAHEIERRIKRLTSVATNLFKRGSYAPAFESLMKAYLLDPSSPHVVACEKTLLPALEIMRQRGSFSSADRSGSGGQNIQLAQLLTRQASAADAPSPETGRRQAAGDKNSPLTDPARILQQQRIEALKQRHEQVKKDREKAMWRNASRPPKIQNADSAPPQEEASKEPQKAPGGLLSKLRQGKFFS